MNWKKKHIPSRKTCVTFTLIHIYCTSAPWLTILITVQQVESTSIIMIIKDIKTTLPTAQTWRHSFEMGTTGWEFPCLMIRHQEKASTAPTLNSSKGGYSPVVMYGIASMQFFWKTDLYIHHLFTFFLCWSIELNQ